jgi:hypothetical protein
LRDSGRLDPTRIADVRYVDLVRDPLSVVRRVYAHFAWQLDARVERHLRAAIDQNTRGGHGRHHYSFDDLPLDQQIERARFAAYQARYDVPSEV